ncbi:hypothetical protein DL768_010405 [Monosporascus sp. mg162]|nr:hypothetical protein DL768_010405 [Monosporascus sp. mg162]
MESPEYATSESSTSNRAARVQEQVEIISKTLDEIESWKGGLGRLVHRTNNEWSEQLQDLIGSVNFEVERLRRLRLRLKNEVDDDSESTDSAPPEQPKSTSELKLARWSSIPHRVESAHPAMYVLVGQVGQDDAKQPGRTDCETCDLVEVSQELPVGRYELPELIIIKSMRLLTYIDFNIHNGSLPWHEDTDQNVTFIILRPFKMLVFFDEEIRSHLVKLEEHRQNIKSMTEDEYDADWRLNPPSDARIPGRKIDIPNQTLPELTGLIKDIRALIRFMDHYVMPAISRKFSEHVYFSDLWYTFPAGSLIYIKDKDVPQKIWKVIQRTGGRLSKQSTASRGKYKHMLSTNPPQFVIDCYYIDFDGNRYIPIFHRIFIEPFDGLEPVTSLPAFPLQAAEAGGYIDPEAMVNRGRKFIECTRPTHQDYTGRNQLQKPNGEEMTSSDTVLPENASRYSEWIDSEVMVDMERALHAVPSWRPSPPDYHRYKYDTDLGGFSNVDNDTAWDRGSTDRLMNTEIEKWQRWDRDHPPTEREDLLLLPGRVFAFVFRTPCLKLGKGPRGEEMLRKRQPRLEPWNDLELPDGHKNLVQSLIEAHMDGNTSRKLHFDLVRAKGKGVILLLHGVPGVGKTSTAECAAEANNRPLLPITCGDLGTSPREVETKLQEAFQLAQLWNCVLLLDEADVFLAQRSEDDIKRNALVSGVPRVADQISSTTVFLRVLEYYEGILFLTSNRVGVFDEALKSRLHMALYYPPLEWKYTKRIWESHLTKLTNSGLIDLDHKDILDYAETFFEDQNQPDSTIGPVWNGRQIRNAFQSAVALAGYKHQGTHKIVLNRDHFEKVSKVSNQFNNYLWSIQCKTDADKASTWGYRHDRWVKPGNTGNTVDPRSRTVRNGSIDKGVMALGLNAAAAGPSYQQQMVSQVAQPMQGFPPQQQQGPMGTQNIFQAGYQKGLGQFEQQQGIVQPQQPQFGQQHQPQYSYQEQQQQQLLQQQQPQAQQQQTGFQGQIQHQTAPQTGQPQAHTQFQPQYGMNLSLPQQGGALGQQAHFGQQGVPQGNLGAGGATQGIPNTPSINGPHQPPLQMRK